MNKWTNKATASLLLGTMLLYTTPVLAYTKDETVYTKLDSNGENYKTIVTDHISGEEEIINDLTDLLNIKNISGDETYTKDENKIIWKTNGEDVYYQGETTKELPISCNITYELDGVEMSKDEIIGKSGKIKIKIKYTNKEKHIVQIQGKNQTLYTPFLVGCGTIFENENNKNIEVKNGKAINDGSKTTIIGLVVPGLQESLDIDKETIDIPDEIEITMDSTNFELGTIIGYATPKVFENEDLDIFNKLDEIYAQVDKLQNASNQIEDGAISLADGATIYSEKSKEFNNAMGQVNNGVASAKNSYTEIDNGISSLNKSSKTLSSSVKTLKDGANAIGDGIQTVDQNLSSLEAGSKALEVGEQKIADGLDKVIAGVNQIGGTDNTAKIKELKQLVSANMQTITTLKTTNENLKQLITTIEDEETIKTLTTQITINTQTIAVLEKDNYAINATITTLEQTDNGEIEKLKQGLIALKQGTQQLQTGTDNLTNGISQLKSGTNTLSSKMNELASGTEKLYVGTKQLTNGTKKLETGSSQMKSGLSTINNGTEQLLTANNSLVEGADTLKNGATTLKEGVIEFNNTGINKICNYIDKDVKNITNRVEELEKLSNEYDTFTMKDEKVKGHVQFMMIVEDKKEN